MLQDDPDRIKRELQRVIGRFLSFEYLTLRGATEYAGKLRPSFSRPAFMNGDPSVKSKPSQAKKPRLQQPSEPTPQSLPSGSGLGSAAQQSGTFDHIIFLVLIVAYIIRINVYL